MELTGYTTRTQTTSYTVEQLVVLAARQKYGGNTKVLLNNPAVEKNISAFWEGSRINSTRMIGDNPVETRRTISDINTKEYINRGTDQGESTVEITKTTEHSKGRSYQWSTTEGVTWGVNANIGAKIAGIPGTGSGGTAGIGGSYQHQKIEQRTGSKTTSETFSFQYAQNEKLVVPPRTKVSATVTTYTVGHEQEYTVEFAFRASSRVAIRYESPLQACWAGLCSSRGFVTANEILRVLPGYREDDDSVYFTQSGKLSWSGEGCEVDKTEEPLTE